MDICSDLGKNCELMLHLSDKFDIPSLYNEVIKYLKSDQFKSDQFSEESMIRLWQTSQRLIPEAADNRRTWKVLVEKAAGNDEALLEQHWP